MLSFYNSIAQKKPVTQSGTGNELENNDEIATYDLVLLIMQLQIRKSTLKYGNVLTIAV